MSLGIHKSSKDSCEAEPRKLLNRGTWTFSKATNYFCGAQWTPPSGGAENTNNALASILDEVELSDLKSQFDAIDVDKNGYISLEEMRQENLAKGLPWKLKDNLCSGQQQKSFTARTAAMFPPRTTATARTAANTVSCSRDGSVPLPVDNGELQDAGELKLEKVRKRRKRGNVFARQTFLMLVLRRLLQVQRPNKLAI
ncbi:EF-Hand 1, calcium-binding site [Sesbania bispinosa]|nr:EF-Hand 1, calcium-binding site [Sesbania bispinosa]